MQAQPEPAPSPKRVKHSGFRYRYPRMDNIEDVKRYAPGGYHPVDIGNTLTNGHNIYTFVHKLGYGGFATVWLAKR